MLYIQCTKIQLWSLHRVPDVHLPGDSVLCVPVPADGEWIVEGVEREAEASTAVQACLVRVPPPCWLPQPLALAVDASPTEAEALVEGPVGLGKGRDLPAAAEGTRTGCCRRPRGELRPRRQRR